MRRCLILANQTLGGPHLIQAVLARQAREPYEFHIVVPATHEHGASMWTEGQAQAHAREALQAALARFLDAGVPASGEVGDENPMLAAGDALRRQPFDEIIVSTLPPGASRWMKRDLPNRLLRKYGLPVAHLIAAPEPVS